MAQLPPIKRLTKEDMKDAPSWIERLLVPLNQFLDSVYRALNGQISFVDNITAQRYSIQLTAGAAATNNTFKFQPTLNKKPEFLIWRIYEKDTNYAVGLAVYVEWFYDGDINISAISGLTENHYYIVNLLIL